MRAKYPVELKELTWNNIYSRPDLQLRTMVLQNRGNYKYFSPYSHNETEALAFADAAYNGGLGGVNTERRACKMASWCDPTKWFGNVEKLCMKSKVALYGNRSACDINRYHVKDVLLVRSNKYEKFFR